MPSETTTKTPLAETAVAYYRTHGPAKAIARVGLNAWRPILLEMIEDYLTLDEIHDWMTNHHEALKFQLPAKTTVRDWLTRVRREINKPLRQRTKLPEPVPQDPSPETPMPTRAQDPTQAVPASSPSPAPEPESEDNRELSMAEKMQIVADKAKAGTLEAPKRETTFVPVSQPRKRRQADA